jgi:hypothetical protein
LLNKIYYWVIALPVKIAIHVPTVTAPKMAFASSTLQSKSKINTQRIKAKANAQIKAVARWCLFKNA